MGTWWNLTAGGSVAWKDLVLELMVALYDEMVFWIHIWLDTFKVPSLGMDRELCCAPCPVVAFILRYEYDPSSACDPTYEGLVFPVEFMYD